VHQHTDLDVVVKKIDDRLRGRDEAQTLGDEDRCREFLFYFASML
jgi:hypothetical protein